MQYGEDGSKLAELKHEFKYDSSGNEKKYVGYEGFSEVDFEYQFDSDGYPIKEMIENSTGTYEKNFEYEDENLI